MKKVKTRKREFLKKMDVIMPWERLYELVKPRYDEETRNEIINSRAFSDLCEVESSKQKRHPRLRSSAENTKIPKNAIPTAAKADSQTEYDVRSGESDFGRQTLTILRYAVLP